MEGAPANETDAAVDDAVFDDLVRVGVAEATVDEVTPPITQEAAEPRQRVRVGLDHTDESRQANQFSPLTDGVGTRCGARGVGCGISVSGNSVRAGRVVGRV